MHLRTDVARLNQNRKIPYKGRNIEKKRNHIQYRVKILCLSSVLGRKVLNFVHCAQRKNVLTFLPHLKSPT